MRYSFLKFPLFPRSPFLSLLMLVEIPAIQLHKNDTCRQLYRRRCIDTKGFASTVPFEDDLFILYFYVTLHAGAVAPLIEPVSVGADLDVVFSGTPGSDVNEVLLVEGLLAGRKEQQGKYGKGKFNLHSFYFCCKIKAVGPLCPGIPVKTAERNPLKFPELLRFR